MNTHDLNLPQKKGLGAKDIGEVMKKDDCRQKNLRETGLKQTEKNTEEIHNVLSSLPPALPSNAEREKALIFT